MTGPVDILTGVFEVLYELPDSDGIFIVKRTGAHVVTDDVIVETEIEVETESETEAEALRKERQLQFERARDIECHMILDNDYYDKEHYDQFLYGQTEVAAFAQEIMKDLGIQNEFKQSHVSTYDNNGLLPFVTRLNGRRSGKKVYAKSDVEALVIKLFG